MHYAYVARQDLESKAVFNDHVSILYKVAEPRTVGEMCLVSGQRPSWDKGLLEIQFPKQH